MSPRLLSVSPRLPVEYLGRTIAFYRDVLGFAAGNVWPEEAPEFVILERDEVRLQFALATAPGTAAATICLDVTDALAIHAAVVAADVPIDWGPEVYWYGRREFSFRDPDGTAIIVSEETSDPPTDTG